MLRFYNLVGDETSGHERGYKITDEYETTPVLVSETGGDNYGRGGRANVVRPLFVHF